MKFLNITIKVYKSLRETFLYYGRNGGIHGLNHLFRDNTFILVRLFWLLMMISSGFSLYLLIIPILEMDNEINFTTDTRYLDWNTNFPAITLCEEPSLIFNRAQKKLEATDIFKKRLAPLNFGHTRYLTELLYGKGTCKNNYCEPCGSIIPCNLPWRELVDLVHSNCEELLADCAYNGVPFPCCEKFLPVDSDFGSCFSFNSLQNKNASINNLLKVNRSTGPGALSFYVQPNIELTVHSVEELSTNTMNAVFKFKIDTTNFLLSFTLTDMENDPMLHEELIEDRMCRFLDEIPDDPFHKYPVYGYRACLLAEETRYIYEHCGCISPVRDLAYKNFYCKNYTGLNCLTEFTVQRTKLGLEDDEVYEKPKDCLPSCVETEVNLVHVSPNVIPKKNSTGLLVVMRLDDIPHIRFRRNVVRTDLDIVVSIGGLLGLFFSASILSVVELFCLLFRKR